MKEMTCREFDEVVHGFVRMELLDVNVREAALEHAAHCELCSQRMADAAALAEASETAGRSAREKRRRLTWRPRCSRHFATIIVALPGGAPWNGPAWEPPRRCC